MAIADGGGVIDARGHTMKPLAPAQTTKISPGYLKIEPSLPEQQVASNDTFASFTSLGIEPG